MYPGSPAAAAGSGHRPELPLSFRIVIDWASISLAFPALEIASGHASEYWSIVKHHTGVPCSGGNFMPLRPATTTSIDATVDSLHLHRRLIVGILLLAFAWQGPV